MRRRQFLTGASLLAAVGGDPRKAFALDASLPPVPRARPFPLGRVRLRPGPFLDAALRNRRYVMELEPDRLLHMFRVTAGLPSTAEPLGGWEQPANELRGHFTGHYLSACAVLGATLGDAEVKARGELMVGELAKCQAALGSGYLSAFPEEFFDRLRRGENVWAPFYTLHKIMAGLLDMHTLAGSAQALILLKGIAGWVRRYAMPLGEAHMARVLEREYGGMNEVLYDLGAATGDASYYELARQFDHERIFAPLAEGRDELKGLHANTTIPKIIGAARRYELLGERRYHDVAEYFWQTVTGRRSYCTGGTSNEESWRTDPGRLAAELSGYTQECCCTYNMLKPRHVFAWTADPACADYHERVLWNGIVGTQHPDDGMTVYYVPLASGYWKLFGRRREAFWCCTGSGLESFAKLPDSVYFHDDAGLYVNQFVPTTLDWAERGVTVVQETRFPEDDTIRLRVEARSLQRFALRVRVPSWVAPGGKAALNGRPLEAFASPGSYFVLDRVFKGGDVVEVTLPMALRACPMPDDPALVAAVHGPIVLAGRLGKEGLTPENLRAEPTKIRQVPEYKSEPVPAPTIRAASAAPSSWLRPVAGRPLEYETVGQVHPLRFEPLHRVFDERYAVYWKTEVA